MTSSAAPRTRIQLIGRDNGAGLSRDMAMLAELLRELGMTVDVVALPHRGRLAPAFTRLRLAWRHPRYDLQIQFERIRPEFARAARRHVLIPNPEWFEPASQQPLLGMMDEVWTKTAHATRLFDAMQAGTHEIGFFSPDRRDSACLRQAAFFHGPGRSGHKGTEALLELWARHPQWPTLTVVWRRKRVKLDNIPANVRLVREHLSEAAYRQLQNSHRFHLCPSRTEGYGHYLVEAMSCAAVVITLDAEPMNELVGTDRGVLVPARACGTQALATLYAFDPAAMEQAIDRCIHMTTAQAIRLGDNARQWYEQQRPRLASNLQTALLAQGLDVPLPPRSIQGNHVDHPDSRPR